MGEVGAMAERLGLQAKRPSGQWLALLLFLPALLLSACAPAAPERVVPTATLESKVAWAVTPAVAGNTPDFATRTPTPQPSPTPRATAKAISTAAVRTPGPAFGEDVLKKAAA